MKRVRRKKEDGWGHGSVEIVANIWSLLQNLHRSASDVSGADSLLLSSGERANFSRST
jgi:hypothetical protein